MCRKSKSKKSNEMQSPIKFTKKIVIFCILFITIYTAVAIAFQATTGDALSDVLTERVFTCLIGELAITGLLKIVESFLKFRFVNNDSEAIDINDVDTDGEGLGEDTVCFDVSDIDNIDEILSELKGE